ncbi:MAG: hypothetical protein JRI68_21975 [Deltaproteobacteria bacterium]|nr:hypothetical protein [Deltaproteobacteria bacterium]
MPAERPDATQLDPLLPTGIVATSVGAFLALGGGLLLGSEDGDEICGALGGCVTRPEPDRELAGGALLGAGLGLIAMGLPTLIFGVGEVPREGDRQSHGMTSAGVVLTAIAAGLAGGGVGTLAADSARGGVDEGGVVIPLFVLGGAVGLAGVPLWALGAQTPATETASTGRRR